VHKKPLAVKTYYVGRVQPHSAEQLAESKAKLLEMAEKDKERMMLEESKNKVESYIYRIKNKLVDDEEEIDKVSTKKQREEVRKLAEAAEEWLYEDGYDADLATMEDKYAELSGPFEKILLRISESTERPKVIESVRKKLTEIEDLMEKWVEAKPQVTEEERTQVLDKVKEARKWIDDKEKAQSKKKAHDDPAFLSDEVPLQLKPLEALVVRLNRKPKPKPEKKKEDKNETSTDAANATATDTNATAAADADTNATTTADEEATGEGEAPPAEDAAAATEADETAAPKEEEDAAAQDPVSEEL